MNLIKSHKVVSGVIALGLIYSGGVAAVYNSQEPGEQQTVEVKGVAATEKKELAIKKEVDEVVNTPVVAAEDTPPIVPVELKVVEPTPAVSSTQEYAEKYLNLSTSGLQTCFDRIVATFPDRFTEDVRENNVKAILAFSSVCSSGILDDSKKNGAIYNFGGSPDSGSFFDSELAKSYHN